MGPPGRLVTIRRSGVDGLHFPLSLRTCSFGRSIECDIRIQLPVVSKLHCRIEIKEQKAVLTNFSSTNPTQVNGSAVEGPVELKHGDLITIIDRSFRYENDSQQIRRRSAEFPGQRREQASPRRVSRSSFSSQLGATDGEVQGASDARAQLTGSVPGGPPGPTEDVGTARASTTPQGRPSAAPAAGAPAGGSGEGCHGASVSGNGGLGSLPAAQCLEKDGENESPFRNLYESMKEELDAKSEKKNVLQSRRRSGSRGPRAAEAGRAGGSQGEAQLWVSPTPGRRSGWGTQTKASPAPGQRGSRQAEEEGAGEGPGPIAKATRSPSIPPTETTKARTPAQHPHPSSSRKRLSGALRARAGCKSVSPGKSKGLWADRMALTPQKPFASPTPTKPAHAGDFGSTPEKVFSRKRRISLPPNVDSLVTEAEIRKQSTLAPLTVHPEKVRGGARGSPERLGTSAAAPGLHSVDVSNFEEVEGVPVKRRRVSFGGHLRPELFDENLPPNTPLKRGETPVMGRSLGMHTPTSLKRIIKQPQPAGNEDSSEIPLEVTPWNTLVSSPARNPVKMLPVANGGGRRSSKPPASSGSGSTPQTAVRKRARRRSSGGPSRRASLGRSPHGLLQMTQARRRSRASEASLTVAKSWADVVKLSAKPAPTKVRKHGPPRPPLKRPRRMSTPKNPLDSVHNEFSTGHANSPCTIVIGKAHVEKVGMPARPYRMLNSFVLSRKMDFSEDLSGLREMFKTPAKEKSQTVSGCPTSSSDSEDLLGKKLQVPLSEEKRLPGTPKTFGERVFPCVQNAPEDTSDKRSASPASRRQCVPVNRRLETPPPRAEPPKAASRAKKFRRSVGLRNTQAPGPELGKEDTDVDTVGTVSGRCLRSPPALHLEEREMWGSEGSFEACTKNIESKENSAKTIAVRRSERSSELKCTPRADLVAMQRWQEAARKEEPLGFHGFLQIPGPAGEAVDVQKKAIVTHCEAPRSGPVGTPTTMNTRLKTPPQAASVDALSALRKPTHTPGVPTHTHREPVAGAKSASALQKTPEQKQNSAEPVTGSRRRSRTPKRKVQPMEDLAGFKELFQTPTHTGESVTEEEVTKILFQSSQPQPVSTPTSMSRRLKRPLGKLDMEEEPSALRKPTSTPRKTMCSARESVGDRDTRAFQETPKQKLDSAEPVTGSRRRSRTPKRKVQPMEDLAGLRELFQTPNHAGLPMTEEEVTKILSQSPQPEPVSTPTSTKRHIGTPLGKVDVEEELSAPRKLRPAPGASTCSHREPDMADEDVKAFQETPKQKLDSAEPVTGSRRRSRTPKRKVQPIEDLAGLRELFQTPNHAGLPMTEEEVTKILSQSPQPEPVSTPTSTKRHIGTPLGKVDVEEKLSAPGKLRPTPGKSTCSHREPDMADEDVKAFQETPKQKLDSAEPVTGSRRRSRTPKRKVQPIEDLAGLRELFQTPNHTGEPMTEEEVTKILSQSSQPQLVSTPTSMSRRLKRPLGKLDMEEEPSALRKPTPTPKKTMCSARESVGDRDTRAFQETPKQKLDSAEPVTGSRRRSRTPKRKVQPIEDLAGLRELFQTPSHTREPATEEEVTKILFQSLQPEPVSTPTSMSRRLKRPLGKLDMEEEPSALRKPTPTPRKTMCSARESVGDRDTRAFQETPKQKLDSAEPVTAVTASRRRSRTPKRKVQPMEDLAGLRELFQTPTHIVETVTDGETQTPCKSPQAKPIVTPTSIKNYLKTSLWKVDIEEELSALRTPTHSPGKTPRSLREPGGGDKSIEFFQETSAQKLDSAEPVTAVTASRRRSRTPKGKVQPIEDLAGLRELFQTPNHAGEPMTYEEVTKILSQSPQPEPVSTPTSTKRRFRTPLGKVDVEEELSAPRKLRPAPGASTCSHREPDMADEDVKAFQETPKQKLDSAEPVTGSRRRSRTPKRKVQPIEDLVGFKELFQTPNHAGEPMTYEEVIKILSQSPQPEPVSTPTSMSRRLKRPLGKLDMEEEPSALRKPTPTPKKTMCSARESVGDRDTRAFQETPKQKLDSAEPVTGSRRRSRTPKRKVQPIEDLAGLRELFQTPSHTREPATEEEVTKILFQSLQPEPVSTPTSMSRRLKRPLGKLDMEEEPSALRKPTPTPRKTMCSARESVGDRDTRAFQETPKQKLDSAEPVTAVTASRRRSRTPKRKVQSMEDLAGLRELFQTPNHAGEPMTYEEVTKILSQSPQPEPVSTPTSTKRHIGTPLGKVDVEEELSAPRKLRPAPGASTCSHREPDMADEDVKAFQETPKQKLDSAEPVTGSRRRSRTPKRKVQRIEDLAGLRELFQTPTHTGESATDGQTEIPWKSPQAKPFAMPTGRNRRLRAATRKVAVEVVLSAPGQPTQTSGKTMRSHRQREGSDKDVRLFKGTPEQKSDPAENLSANRRRPRTRKEKTQPLEDPASLQELSQNPSHTDEPVTIVETTKIHSRSLQPEAMVLPARTRRRLKAPPGGVDKQEEPSALRKPTRTSGKTTRSHRQPVEGEKDIKVCEGSPAQELGPAESTIGRHGQLRSRKGKAQPPEGPARCEQPFQSSDQGQAPGRDAAHLTSPPRTPEQSKSLEPSRRVLRALTVKPMGDLVGGTDPVQPESKSLVSLSLKKNREDGSVSSARRRLRTRVGDPAEEKLPQKRRRTTPSGSREPPEVPVLRKRQRALAESLEPVVDPPSKTMTAKDEGCPVEAVTSADKGLSLRSRRPGKTEGAEPRPEIPVPAEKVKTRRNGRKPLNTSQEALTPCPGGEAATSASSGHEGQGRQMSLRSRARRKTPLPSGAGDKARARGAETPVKTQDQTEGAPRSGITRLRSRKATVPPPGDTVEERRPEPRELRVTRNTKRSTEPREKEQEDAGIQRARTRRRR
ncbi:proliferation marker protein Ki-67 isoform X2 [Saccopteryx bilineata]|uniref:proliferation marker protein Ki-67 isoform X2 n=1 Tax=Saccopteryx bilineata TaxID=59482 RepID=UPI00338D73D9